MMDYMYRGEVNISQDQLAALLKAAESLQIKGLSDNRGGGSSASSAPQKSDAAPAPTKSVPSSSAAPSAATSSKSGLTIEQHKRPLKHIATDAELSGSREGSTSPSARKRKKVRRRSIDTNNAIDNHDQMSNSSSQSSHQTAQQQQAQLLTSTPLAPSQINTATSAANVLNVTKKTDIHNTNVDQRTDDDDDDGDDIEQEQPKHHKRHKATDNNKDKNLDSELLIEPKSEYEDGEPVEDLTMDDEELLEDLEQAGPSHGGEGSSQG